MTCAVLLMPPTGKVAPCGRPASEVCGGKPRCERHAKDWLRLQKQRAKAAEERAT